MNEEFKSSEELFQRVKPALVTKQNEMLRKGFHYVKIEDVWEYLKKTKWRKASNLGLYDMVYDILNAEDTEIYANKIKQSE